MKNFNILILFSLVAIASLGCTKNTSVSSLSQAETRDAEVFDVFEALLRYQRDNTNEKAYFISIGGEDPSSAFLERVDVNGTAVKKLSEYAQGVGLKLNIAKWTWISNDLVEVELHSSKVVNASTIQFTMKRNEGAWIVHSQKCLFISCGKEPGEPD